MPKGGLQVADEPITVPHVPTGPSGARSNRGILGLVGVVIVLVVVALILLMFRGCEAEKNTGSTSGGAKEIVPVAGMAPDPGCVSVWVDGGGDIEAILRIAGLEDSTATSMGGGRYVISVPPGTEESVVRLLAGMNGVHDAGLVYCENE